MRLRGRHSVDTAEEIEVTPAPVTARPPADFEVREGGRRLGELIVDARLATQADVLAALEEVQQGATKRLGRLLIDRGVITERDLTRMIAEQSAVAAVDLRSVTPNPEVAGLITAESARALLALPLSAEEDGAVLVAVVDPTETTVASLRGLLGREVRIAVAGQSDLLRSIDNTYRAITEVSSQVKLFEARDGLRRDSVRMDAAEANDEAPVVRVVQMMITQGVRDRASDIHIEPQNDRVRVRYRIDGALHDVLDLPGSMGPAIVSRVKILGGMNIVERRRAQDGQISTEVEGRAVDIRVSTTAVVGGEKVVLRLLDKSRPLFDLGQLGMPAEMAQRYSQTLRAPYGMVICAGPTGSGKTTTLYGSLAEINSPERNIMTIEDPVEYTFPSINQIQINDQAGITFAGGLRSILRQDPDVILVGEVRDRETAQMALSAAETGHLVFTTLHTRDA
ncbi:MAG: type II/IV secretion system protein, partial [Actinobacteria bacterium]|nr:type II/IV secretion system protein [Actinomycetota bacterium]